MRITGIKTTPVAVPLNINTTDAYLRKGPAVLIEAILEVFTDEGITGIAEIPVVAGATMAADLVKSAESIVIGKDPADVNVILKELYSCYNLNHLHMHAANWAVNSIERACWDIMGQKAGLPLYKLWGGGFRKEVEVFGFIEAEDLDEIRRVSKLRAEQGYKVIYTKVGFSTPEYDVAMVKAIREGAPDPSIKIRVDANQAWNVGEAISIINQMEPYGIDCVDQPVIMYNLDALKDVKNATHVPIAAHESTWTMYDMLKVIKENAADIVHIVHVLLLLIDGADRAQTLRLARGQIFPEGQFAIDGIQVAPEVSQLLPNGFAGHFRGVFTASCVFQVIFPGTFAVRSRLLSVRGIVKNIQKRFAVLPGLVEQGNILRIPRLPCLAVPLTL